MPCNWVENLLTVGHNLECQGLTFAPLDCANWLLGREDEDLNIAATSKGITPLITGWVHPLR